MTGETHLSIDEQRELARLKKQLADWRATGKHKTDGLRPTLEAVLVAKIERLETPGGHDTVDGCVAADLLTFVGHIAAPGYGESWSCDCGRPLVKIGGSYYDPRESGPFELSPEDVR